MDRNYQICKNCVMDTSDSKIEFDNEGVCDHCNTFKKEILPKWQIDDNSIQKLNLLVSKIKKAGKGKEFDCILGMSGGLDSSYLLHKICVDFGLRPLVFHVDAGWNSQIAVNNIEKLVDGLGLDLYTEVINWEEIKDLQLSFFKSGLPNIDVPQDHAFFATMYKFASEHNINYILSGGNFSTECIRNPLEWMWYQSDSWLLKDVHKKFGKINLETYPITNILWHKVYLPYLKGIKLIRPLDFINYNKTKAADELVKTYGFQRYPQKHFESRFTRFYESYWLYERFGFDTRRVQFSSLILTNQMTRNEALEELKKKPYDIDNIKHDFNFVAEKLGISYEELVSYFKMPRKTHNDYNSQKIIYTVGSFFMKHLGLEKGGKR